MRKEILLSNILWMWMWIGLLALGLPSTFAQESKSSLKTGGQQPQQLAADCGTTVVSCFSGFDASGPPTLSNDAVVGLVDVRNATGVTQGIAWNTPAPPMTKPSGWNATRMGQVFGLAIDDNNLIYTTATTLYGIFPAGSAGTGGIYQLNPTTFSVNDFIVTTAAPGIHLITNTIYNTGSGLGNICYDSNNAQFFVTNFEDGTILRISSTGVVLEGYDFAGTTTFSASASNFANLGERLWGIGYNKLDNRVYFSVWNEDESRSHATINNEIWSIGLTAWGSFNMASVVREIVLPNNPNLAGNTSNPVSDIAFSENGDMLVSERTMKSDFGTFHISPFYNGGGWAHGARILEYVGVSGSYSFAQEIYTGNYSDNTNSAGGIDYGYGYTNDMVDLNSCDQYVWATGDALRYPNYNNASGLGGQDAVYGLAGMPTTGNSNVNNAPDWVKTTSYYIDLDGDLTTLNGATEKSSFGDVEIFKCAPCTNTSTNNPSCATILDDLEIFVAYQNGYDVGITPLIGGGYTVTNYHIDFGDGTTNSSAGPVSFVHSYTSPGTDTVCVTITVLLPDGTSLNCTKCETVVICCPDDIALTANSPAPLTVDVSPVIPASQTVLYTLIDFGDGTTIPFSGTTPIPITHVYPVEGFYSICMEVLVMFPDGTIKRCYYYETVEVCSPTICPPSICSDDIGSDILMQNGLTVTVIPALNDTDVVNYQIDFGDGTIINSPNWGAFTHTYAASGCYDSCKSRCKIKANGAMKYCDKYSSICVSTCNIAATVEDYFCCNGETVYTLSATGGLPDVVTGGVYTVNANISGYPGTVTLCDPVAQSGDTFQIIVDSSVPPNTPINIDVTDANGCTISTIASPPGLPLTTTQNTTSNTLRHFGCIVNTVMVEIEGCGRIKVTRDSIGQVLNRPQIHYEEQANNAKTNNSNNINSIIVNPYECYYILTDAAGMVIDSSAIGDFLNPSPGTYEACYYCSNDGVDPMGMSFSALMGCSLGCDTITVPLNNMGGLTVNVTSSTGSGGISPFYFNTTEIEVIGGTPPYNYSWQTIGFVRHSIIGTGEIRVLFADNAFWSVTITDANGCSTIVTSDGSVGNGPTLPTINNYTIFNATNHPTCDNGSVTIDVIGGTSPYTYNWSGPATWNGTGNGTNSISNATSGWYSVTVTDTTGETTTAWYWMPCEQGGRGKTTIYPPSLQIIPNPSTTQASLSYYTTPDLGPVALQIYDYTGRLVKQHTGLPPEGQQTLQTADFMSGTYLVIITQNGRVVAKEKWLVLE